MIIVMRMIIVTIMIIVIMKTIEITKKILLLLHNNVSHRNDRNEIDKGNSDKNKKLI